MIFSYYKNCLYTHRYKFSSEKEKKKSQYMVSHPETGSDPPIGSDRESGRDTLLVHFPFWFEKHVIPFSFYCYENYGEYKKQ